MAINPKITLLDLYSDPNSFQYQSKNLKYDKDIRGGGYSGQPFIKRVAPKNNDNLDTLPTEALSLDYPIRGGSYEELAAREDFMVQVDTPMAQVDTPMAQVDTPMWQYTPCM